MSDHDEIIILFTSNGEALYAQDAINLVAQPENTLVHFRYREKWIGDELLTDIRTRGVADVLVGRKVLCVFVDRTIHPDVPILVPTRYATIQSAETEGTFHHIDFTVGKYYCWRDFASRACGYTGGSEIDFKHWITSFRQMLEGEFRDLQHPGATLCGPPDKYLTRVHSPDRGQLRPYFYEGRKSDEGRDFEDVVGALHSLPYFSDTVFFRVRTVEEYFSKKEYLHIFPFPFLSHGRFAAKTPVPINARQLAGGKFGYNVRRVAPYRFRLAIVNGKELSAAMKETTLEVAVNDDQATTEDERFRIGAKNDFVSFVLFPVFQANDVVSRVSIHAMQAGPKDAVEVDSATRSAWQAEWLTHGDRRWIDARRDALKLVDKPLFFPRAAVIAGPTVNIDVESNHSSFYLRVGGLMLLFGYVLNFTVTEEWLKFVRRISPSFLDTVYHVSWVTLGSGMFVVKILGVYLLYCAFVVATRKLPTLK